MKYFINLHGHYSNSTQEETESQFSDLCWGSRVEAKDLGIELGLLMHRIPGLLLYTTADLAKAATQLLHGWALFVAPLFLPADFI